MPEFYKKIHGILESYIKDSDTAKRFLDRQIKYHLSKPPEAIAYEDKEDIAKWCRISASLILKEDQADELHQKILSLE